MALLGLTTFNHWPFTSLCLKYLAKNTDLMSNRVIVVDNGSTDGTPERIKAEFPWVEKVILNDENSMPRAFNLLIKELKSGEDHVFLPNDVVVGKNWLELLKEDAYRYENVGITSPYIPFDLMYDEVVNEDFANNYFKFYENLRNDPSSEELEQYLDGLYGGDFEQFCLDFQQRNRDEPPLDESLTHVMYYKNWLFEKVGLYNEDLKPFGNEDRDFFIRLNNAGIFRTCSSRSFAHHWLSITQRQRFHDWDAIQAAAYKTSIRLIQRWEPIEGSEFYMDVPKPSRIPNWRTHYRKFRLRDQELPFEEARAVNGIPFMKWDGLNPGTNYFKATTIGSTIRKNDNNFRVIDKTKDMLIFDCSGGNGLCDYYLGEAEFLKDKWHLDYFNRR